MRQKIIGLLTGLILLVSSASISRDELYSGPANQIPHQVTSKESINTPPYLAYLPLITHENLTMPRTVNAPYFNVVDMTTKYTGMAIFWLGQVSPTTNYTDVRVGYNNTGLYVHLNVYDRLLWYDPNPDPSDLTSYDSASLYLFLDNGNPDPYASTYRFDAQINDWEPRGTRWQTAYQNSPSGWVGINLPFTTPSSFSWESDTVGGINNGANNRGWSMLFSIPFSSLNYAQRPADNSEWRMALVVHDRDTSTGNPPIPDQTWPESLVPNQPFTWGRLHFGLQPAYTPPAVTTTGTVIIRNKLNGAIVPDAAVGGTIGNLCPGDPTFIWNQWANLNFGSALSFNLQNQIELADWPCFAKYYLTFPLHSIPVGKVIVSAKLTLHVWGGSDPDHAFSSLVQVDTVREDWNEMTLTWNNAPMALENINQTWVEVYRHNPPLWPGAAYDWDVSRSVAQAYTQSIPLRLAVYEADAPRDSGKYFTSSDEEDWNAAGRPTLTVVWGDPQ